MTFEQKKEAAKVLARSIMNTMVEQNVPLEDCTEILGMTTAAICGAPPEPLEPREQVASFLVAFSDTLSAGIKIKEGKQ
jgi:hypothetical protein